MVIIINIMKNFKKQLFVKVPLIVVPILIISMILIYYFISDNYNSYKTVNYIDFNYDKGLLEYNESDIELFTSGIGMNITIEEAVKITYTIISDFKKNVFIKPFIVYFDEEHNAYMIFAKLKNENSIYKVTIDKNTGGVLHMLIYHF